MKFNRIGGVVALLGICLATACGDMNPSLSASENELSNNGVNATIDTQSDWGSGYCAKVALANTSSASVTSWTLVIDLGQSTLSQLWGVSYTQNGTQLTVKSSGSNSNIAPGGSISFGLCGSGSGRPALATLSVTGGSSSQSSYSLTIGASSNGSTDPNAGTYSYTAGTAIKVTATPASGYQFSGWSGAATGTSNPLTIQMDANKTLTAAFSAASSQSSGSILINAGGSAVGSYSADNYYSGGSTYSTTSSIDTSLISGTIPPQAVLQSERYGQFSYSIPNLSPGSAQTVTLYFQESYFSAAGKRSFDVIINGTTVLKGFDIFATAGGAKKAVAQTFSTSADSSGRVVIQFAKNGVDNPKVCAIAIAAGGTSVGNTLTVKTAGAGNGTVAGTGINCGSACTASYTSGTSVTLTATPASGSTFAGWSGAATGTANSISITMDGDKTVTATFTHNSSSSGGTRLGGAACQAGTSYPAPTLTGSPKLLYKPSGYSSGTFEGPVWLPENSALLFSDISFTGSVNPSRLLELTSGGSVTTLLSDAGINGMSVDQNGTVLACSHKVQGIVRLNLASGTLTTVVDNIGGKKFNSPNDLVVRSDGTIYFTDPDFQLGSRTSATGKKGVYRVSPAGTVSTVDDTFAEPNGIALSPDETVLYVADYNSNVVRSFDVANDGSTSGRKTFASVSSPDGLAMDCLGNLYVASGSPGVIQVYSPSGSKLGSITVASSLSNMAFGGADGKTLYITAGKALYSFDMNLPGYSN